MVARVFLFIVVGSVEVSGYPTGFFVGFFLIFISLSVTSIGM